MVTWRSQMKVRGPAFDAEPFMRRYLWTVVNVGISCLVAGFATSPVHPGDSFFTALGAIGMPVFVLGFLCISVAIDVADGTGRRDDD
jgi:hypothetical protein